jgi:hypothetical protein
MNTVITSERVKQYAEVLRDMLAVAEAAAQAAKKAAEAEGRRAAALAALEAERGDLTADAYERRKKALAVVS